MAKYDSSKDHSAAWIIHVRDTHESQKITSRVDEAKLEQILAEHDPFKK